MVIKILTSITGLLPILSESVPHNGENKKFMSEYNPAIKPICKEVACSSLEKIGKMGITNPNPSKSMKMVKNNTTIGDLDFILQIKN